MKSRALDLAALALLVSLCGWTGGGIRPAAAQALDAGKPPAQIFSGTCSACHRSPRGLVRNVSAGSLPGFLRQHYTTGNEMAGVMAAYVLGNGGTDRVAEPPPKREPKQKAKSDGQDVAAHTPDAREQSKAAKQKAGKKGQVEPAAKDAPAPKDTPDSPVREADKTEPAKQEAATNEPPKADAAAVECKVEPPKPTVATDETKPPRQPTSLLTLPGFPAPEPAPEAEPEPAGAAAAPAVDCEPKAATTTAASVTPPSEPASAELPKEKEPQPPAPATAPAAVAEAPKIEPLRSAVTDTTAATPSVNIMQEEVHAPRPSRTGGQKKRAQQQQ